MVRDLRIKSTIFTPADLTSDSDGNLDVFSTRPLNGTIQKLQWEGGNSTATGSLYITISGTVSEDIITTFRSGTQFGNVAGNFTKYPVTQVVEQALGSNVAVTDAGKQTVINSLVRIQGSGLGNAKSGLGFTVFYI